MGMFMPDDKFYDETKRQVGFRRYTQLLERHWGDWMKLNAVTILGLLPLILGITLGISSSSILVLFPCSAVGGMIAGPFIAGLYDNLLRCMRDDSKALWKCYRKSWKQNWKGSLIPGLILGVALGIFSFTGMLFWWASKAPSLATVLLVVFSAMMTLVFFQLYFTQLVLFDASPKNRVRNIILFTIQQFWRMLGVALLQIAYWLVYVMFAPWSLLILPIVGIWYILFVSELLIYDQLDEAFNIEERFSAAS